MKIILLSQKQSEKVQYQVIYDCINSFLPPVSTGPNKKPFSLKEKKPGDGEVSPSTEDAPFQHSPLGKAAGRAGASSLLNKRWDRSLLMTLFGKDQEIAPCSDT